MKLDRELPDRRGSVRSRATTPTQRRTDPCLKLGDTDRFDDVLIGAEVQALHLVGLFPLAVIITMGRSGSRSRKIASTS